MGRSRRLSILTATIAAALLGPTLWAQTPATKCDAVDTSEIIVPLDGTGIADWRFLNPRRPFPLVRETEELSPAPKGAFRACLREVTLRFDNRTGDQVFDVKLGVLAGSPAKQAHQALADLMFQQAVVDLWRERRRREEQRQQAETTLQELEAGPPADATDKELERARAALTTAERELDEPAPQPTLARLAKAVASLPPGKRQRLDTARLLHIDSTGEWLDQLEQLALPAQVDPKITVSATARSEIDQAVDLCWQRVEGLDELFDQRQIRGVLSACSTGESSLARAVEKAADTLPAAERNRWWLTAPPRKGQEHDRKAAWTELREALQQASRFFRAYSAPAAGAGGSRFRAAPSRLTLDGPCRLSSGKLACTRTLNILPQERATLPGSALAELPRGLATFDVDFAETADIPANKTGYLQTVSGSVDGGKKKTEWTLNGSVGYQRDPLTPGKDDDGKQILITPERPYDGDQRRHQLGAGSLRLDQKVGSRAVADVTFRFKDGDLGEKDSSGDTTVPGYRMRFFGDNGVVMSFGKTSFTSSIASNESGEGYEWYLRGVSVGQIIKRESVGGVADDADEDHEVFFVQAKNFSLGDLAPASTRFNLLAAYGEDDEPDSARSYWTAGGEMLFNLGRWYGELAVYRSERTPEGSASREVEGDGTSALLSLTRSSVADGSVKKGRPGVKKGTPLWSVGLQLGYGSGDDPATSDRDEGFLGETAGFAPDTLFLKRFAGKIGSDDETVAVAPGLANKQYLGVTWTSKTFTPLEAISRFFQVREPAASRSTSVSFHHYRFNEPVFGERGAGSELDVSFSLQLPKGVTTTLSAAYFFVGDALDPVLPEEPWAVSLGVSVKL